MSIHTMKATTGRAALALAAAVALWVTAAVPQAAAQERGRIAGTVVTPEGEAAAEADIRVVGLGRRVRADLAGRFEIENVPPGSYVLEVSGARGGVAVERVSVGAGATTTIRVDLRPIYHVDPIISSVGPGARTRSEVYQPTSVLSGAELRLKALSSLGETLKDESGVTSTYFGPGASRPIIRGLGGDRVRVLEGGIGSFDVSNTSPDHAVSIEPNTAERIEIIRGPATLLYGSSAVGGVVNVHDNRVPSDAPPRPVSGFFQGQGGTVAEEINASGELSGGAGPIAWRASALWRDTDDYGIPGFAEADHGEEEEEPGHEEEEPVDGVLENSALETLNGSVGVSYVGEDGYVGVSWSGYDTNYGVPGGHGHQEEEPLPGEEEEEEGAIAIDLEQWRVDLEGAWTFATPALQSVKARVGYSDYQHQELEGTELGTRFDNEAWEARLEAQHGAIGPVTGAVGVQVGRRDFSAIGEEAFVPPTESNSWAIFALEELRSGPLAYQLGARFERVDHESSTGLQRDDEGFSISGGVNWSITDDHSAALSLTRSTRLPTGDELFSDGPHAATRSFEIGDPGLDKEVAYTADATLSVTEGPVTGSVTGFASSFDDFIFLAATGEEMDELAVRRYRQEDALFLGFELDATVRLIHEGSNHLALLLFSDFVRAELTEADEPLPQIPPWRFGGGLRYERGPWGARISLRRVTEQDRVAAFEEPTEGYTMLDASLGYRIFLGGTVHQFVLRGTNLTDEEARNHVSFLKESAPLPGRDIRLTYRVGF